MTTSPTTASPTRRKRPRRATVNAVLTATTGSRHGTVFNGPGIIEGAWVIAIGPTGVAGSAVTDGNGEYRISGLPLSTNRATILDPGEYPQEWFDDASGYATATLFSVTGNDNGGVTVDATLGAG